MSSTNINIGLEGVGHALSDNKLAVPIFQRSYAWEERHVVDLFLDISSAIQKGEKEYFLGSIVTTTDSDKDRLIVVDGQQRLATTTILLAAMRDYFLEHDEKDRAFDLSNEYLSKRQLRSQEIEPRLKLNDTDNEFFYQRIVLGKKDVKKEPLKESHRRIEKAYAVAKEHVRTLVKSTNSPIDLLLEHIEYIAHKLKVIWVEVPDYTNAFTIFETLNDRGLDLAISDLLKNYLFFLSSDRIQETMQKWNSMYSIIEQSADESEVVNYIRYLWSSTYGVAREKELYDMIKSRITSKQAAVDFTEGLLNNSKLYSAILNPEHEYWKDFGSTAKNYMITLKLLGMVQVRPLLLAILDKFTKKDVIKSLKLLTSSVVRFTVTGTLSTGVFEKQFSQWAIDIRREKIRNASDLMEAMKRSIPNDKVFEEGFAIASVSRGNLARYYLSALERQKLGNKTPELIPNNDEREVNLEHILPVSPSESWNYINDDDIKSYTRRLGNMCLLNVKLNSAGGNDDFSTKKKYFSASAFKLTSALNKYDTWNVFEIEQRQRKLAKLAIKTWPISVS